MADSKIQAPIDLPADLVTFFVRVAEMISAGDDAVTIESDDLIQIEEFDAYGGLYDSRKALFGFVYFPDTAAEKTQWHLQLTVPQIRQIATGKLSTIPGWKCSHPDCRNRYSAADGYCGTCDHPAGREQVLQWRLDRERFEEVNKVELEQIGGALDQAEGLDEVISVLKDLQNLHKQAKQGEDTSAD